MKRRDVSGCESRTVGPRQVVRRRGAREGRTDGGGAGLCGRESTPVRPSLLSGVVEGRAGCVEGGGLQGKFPLVSEKVYEGTDREVLCRR